MQRWGRNKLNFFVLLQADEESHRIISYVPKFFLHFIYLFDTQYYFILISGR